MHIKMYHGYRFDYDGPKDNRIFIFLLFFLLFLLTAEVSSLDLTNDSKEGNLLNYTNEFLELNNFSLRKCHCGADQVWKQGVCTPTTNTSVEVVLHFTPSITKKKFDTNEFVKLYVDDLVCDEDKILTSIKHVAFTTNNKIYHSESGEPFSEFCVEHIVNAKGKVSLHASVCLPSLSVPVCCPPHHLLDHESLQCYKNNTSEYHPPIRLGLSLINSSSVVNYFQSIPKCNKKYFEIKILDTNDNVTLQYQDSKIILFEWEGAPVHSMPREIRFPTDFCVGINGDPDDPEQTYVAVAWDELLSEECEDPDMIENESENCETIMYWLLLPLLIVSSLCLLVVLCLHASMSELRKSMGSKITICHVFSLFGGFCVLILIRIPQDHNCKIYGPLVQFFFHAAFFWLNVMCFDIWWKLRCHNPAGETIQSSQRRFIKYSIYAWASPVAICIITIIMDNTSQLDGIPWIIRPGFGQKHCWFSDHDAALVYYFGIIGFLMATNIFFFVWVFVILLKANCTYNKVLKNNPKATSRTWVYLKVFGVMGVTWIFEFLSEEEGTCKYWVVTDIINSLRGCILLSIYFCNRKSATKIRSRFTDFNQTLHTQFARSVNSLRKLSRERSHNAFIDGLESRRTSDTACTDIISARSPPRDMEFP